MSTRLNSPLLIALLLALSSAAAAQALASRTDSAWSYVNRGNDWHTRGEFERALSDYTLALSLDPQLAWAYLNRAIVRTHRVRLTYRRPAGQRAGNQGTDGGLPGLENVHHVRRRRHGRSIGWHACGRCYEHGVAVSEDDVQEKRLLAEKSGEQFLALRRIERRDGGVPHERRGHRIEPVEVLAQIGGRQPGH